MFKFEYSENTRIFSKFKNLGSSKCYYEGACRIYLRKLAQLEIPKNRGELYNGVKIAKSKNWKTDKFQEFFRNLKKKIGSHAKF